MFWYNTVPAPLYVALTSVPTSPIRPIGANVTLTCTVVLSPAVDVSVTVDVQLIDPAGSPLTTTPLSVSGSVYMTTSMISSFEREQSGSYTCTTVIRSSLLFLTNSWQHSASTIVTVGEEA